MDKKKVFVLGIDGATFDIIKPMIAEGKLPNLASMMQHGSYGDLRSTIPPNSSVAWTSFATGKNAGKHGIYYFREKKEGSYDRPIISSRSRKCKTLWKMLSEQGKKVGVINVPVTYPPEEVNGYLISGLLAPNRNSVFTYPPGLHLELLKELEEYPLDNEAEISYRLLNDELVSFQHLVYSTKKMMQATFYLMQKSEWDFFISVPTIVDRVQHIAWKYMVPEFKEKNPALCQKFENTIEISYQIVDEYLGKLKSYLDQNTTLIIMSDHGFGPISYRLYLNRWLKSLGLLKLKRHEEIKYRIIKSGKTFLKRLIGAIARRFGLPGGILKKIEALPLVNINNDFLYNLIDWSKTKAFSSFTNGEEIIMVNLEGREPNGIVKPGKEYEALRDLIIEKLLQIKDDNKDKLVDQAYKREDIYSGPYVHLAPDIQFTTKDMSVQPRSDLFGEELLVRPDDFSPALHRMNGIFLAEGNAIKQNTGIKEAAIIDLAPTILYLLGMPVPKDMDGKVLASCFKEDYLNGNPIMFSDHQVSAQNDTNNDETYTEHEKNQLKDALKGLGYM